MLLTLDEGVHSEHRRNVAPTAGGDTGSSGIKRRNFLAGSAVAVAAPSILLSACTSSGPSANGAAAKHLTIAINSPGPLYAHAYLAEQNGYNKQHNVSVQIINAGSNALDLLLSGRADMIIAGMGSALLPVQSGKPTIVVYSTLGNGVTAMVGARKGVTSMQEIRRIGSGAIGTSSYGYASFYKKKLALSYDIIPYQDNDTMSASLAGGAIDAAVSSASVLLPLQDTGKATILIDPRIPSIRNRYIGGSFPESGAIADKAQANNDAIGRYVAALKQSQAFLATHTASEIATILHKVPDLQSIEMSSLTTQVAASLPSFGPNNGLITPAVWKLALSQYAYWGLGLNVSQPQYSYGQRVDMAFYNNAT